MHSICFEHDSECGHFTCPLALQLIHSINSTESVWFAYLLMPMSSQQAQCQSDAANARAPPLQKAVVQAYEEHVQELDRLRWIHEASQLQLITALAWQAKQEAMLASAKASIDKPSALQVCFAAHNRKADSSLNC